MQKFCREVGGGGGGGDATASSVRGSTGRMFGNFKGGPPKYTPGFVMGNP